MHAYTHRELLIPFCNYENITRTHDISRRGAGDDAYIEAQH